MYLSTCLLIYLYVSVSVCLYLRLSIILVFDQFFMSIHFDPSLWFSTHFYLLARLSRVVYLLIHIYLYLSAHRQVDQSSFLCPCYHHTITAREIASRHLLHESGGNDDMIDDDDDDDDAIHLRIG